MLGEGGVRTGPKWHEFLGLAVVSPCLAMGGLLLSSFPWMALENSASYVGPSISYSEALSLVSVGKHWLRGVTMESLLTSGCGVSLKSAQDDCNGTCVKFRTWKPTGHGNMVV